MQIEIRKGIKEVDNTSGMVFKIVDTKDHLIIENDYLSFGVKDLYHVKFSSRWFATRVLLSRIFNFRKAKPVFVFKNIDIDKYYLDIFYGLEELGVVQKASFYYRHIDILGMHPNEPVWMGDELVELNKQKFIRYLERHTI